MVYMDSNVRKFVEVTRSMEEFLSDNLEVTRS